MRDPDPAHERRPGSGRPTGLPGRRVGGRPQIVEVSITKR